MIDRILKTYGEVNTTANGYPPEKRQFVCDLCNTDAENETDISAVPQTVHVCFIFISIKIICKFHIFTYLQFRNIRATTCYFIHGYYNLCIICTYMFIV